jgi:hypothetical protein
MKIYGEYLALGLQYLVARAVTGLQIDDCMRRAETIRSEITDVETAMNLDAQSFKASAAVGDVTRASAIFERYYDKVRFVVSNLPRDYVSDYVRDPQLTGMIDTYRRLKARDPGQR